jgi:hypothetical protein
VPFRRRVVAFLHRELDDFMKVKARGLARVTAIIAGCGIFPTESAANPTFTLNALSLRGAEQLVGAWGSVAG